MPNYINNLKIHFHCSYLRSLNLSITYSNWIIFLFIYISHLSFYFSPHSLPSPASRKATLGVIPFLNSLAMYITHDILLEIFSWLPAKSVYKFKCVNKFCKNISSPGETYFIQKQSQNALLRDDSCFFLQPN